MARQRGIPKPRGLGLSASNAPASEAEPLSGLTVAPQTSQRGLGGLPHERMALTLLAQQSYFI